MLFFLSSSVLNRLGFFKSIRHLFPKYHISKHVKWDTDNNKKVKVRKKMHSVKIWWSHSIPSSCLCVQRSRTCYDVFNDMLAPTADKMRISLLEGIHVYHERRKKTRVLKNWIENTSVNVSIHTFVTCLDSTAKSVPPTPSPESTSDWRPWFIIK